MKFLIANSICVYTCFTIVKCSVNPHTGSTFFRVHLSNSGVFLQSNSTNSTNILNRPNHYNFYNGRRQSLNFESLLPANQRKCLKDVLYIVRNINAEWAIKSKLFSLF